LKDIRIDIVGLGRMGRRHGENLKFRTHNAQFTAACNRSEESRLWAEELAVPNLYADYGHMLQDKDLDAVIIASPSEVHYRHITEAMEAGFHVFCEKPMSMTVSDCLAIEKLVAGRPQQVFMVGFVRRFDPDYVRAKRRIDAGAIGKPYMVRSQTADMNETISFMSNYAATSGGIFLDMNVHDIDLARWYLQSEVESVYATGGCYTHRQFEKWQDADNTTAVLKFKNGTMANISASRTAAHGHDSLTEIIGNKGKIQIGNQPTRDRITLYDQDGMSRECVSDYYERFAPGFQGELQEFVDCIAQKRQPSTLAADATRATEIALAMTQSFRNNKIVMISR